MKGVGKDKITFCLYPPNLLIRCDGALHCFVPLDTRRRTHLDEYTTRMSNLRTRTTLHVAQHKFLKYCDFFW